MNGFIKGVLATILAGAVCAFGFGELSVDEIKKLPDGDVYTDEEIYDLQQEAYKDGYSDGYDSASYDEDYDYSPTYTDAYDPSDTYANREVYYTESGKSFHINRDCYHIRNKYVLTGRLGDLAGRLDPCHDCSEEVWAYYD